MSILNVSNLKAHYIIETFGKVNHVKAVDGVSFEVRKDEIYGIAGESGCGKSTLLKAITGQLKPPLELIEGEVTFNFNNKKINIFDFEKKTDGKSVRGELISKVPQGSMSVLNPIQRIRKTFRDYVGAHRNIKNKKEFETMVKGHLQALGLKYSIMDAYPHQLSGGMKQRVSIALATILKPEVVFADEPTTALDVVVQRGVVQLIKKIKKEQQNTMVMVTHDLSIHASVVDRIAIMYAGEIVEEGDIKVIFNKPAHPYTQLLLKALPRLGDKSPRVSAPGAPPSLINVPSGCRFHPRCSKADEKCKKINPELLEIEDGHRVACLQKGGE
ncbi:MAG: ABC transporter ATP-binding protein [Halothermotrichaceae bacterium]